MSSLIITAERRNARVKDGGASVLVAGQPMAAGIASYEDFERHFDRALHSWTTSLGAIVASDALDETTRFMLERYARDRSRRAVFVANRRDDFGYGAGASICNRQMIDMTTHALIFAAQADRDAHDVYRRVVREFHPFIKIDA